jgi:ribose 5-phosphate isomerase B
MEIYIGSDFRGFETRKALIEFLNTGGHDVNDMGNYEYVDGDDFNDAAVAVSKNVRENRGSVGILICGSGHGMTIQANRFKGIRATLCDSVDAAIPARKSDDANVLCLAADRTDIEKAKEITTKFLETDFEPLERRVRRMNRLDEREDYD